jgi:hypothetical protein
MASGLTGAGDTGRRHQAARPTGEVPLEGTRSMPGAAQAVERAQTWMASPVAQPTWQGPTLAAVLRFPAERLAPRAVQ